MEWNDEAIILALQKYGEADAILDVLTKDHGRARGFVRGGMGRKQRGILQPGNGVHLVWRARVATNLGSFTVESGPPRAAHLFGDAARLGAMTGMASLLKIVLPEHEQCPHVYAAFTALLDLLSDENSDLVSCGVALVRFEAGILSDQGFGLDLAECASTGENRDLIYVSPKSARAVSAEAGEPYKDKLLPLPAFMLDRVVPEQNKARATPADVVNGLRLTAYFLRKHLLLPADRELPEARMRLPRYFSSAEQGDQVDTP